VAVQEEKAIEKPILCLPPEQLIHTMHIYNLFFACRWAAETYTGPDIERTRAEIEKRLDRLMAANLTVIAGAVNTGELALHVLRNFQLLVL
jgi:hypothetical protein